MSARQQFFALAAKHGIHVEYAPDRFGPYRLELVAPDGKWFKDSGSMFDCSLMGWDDDPHTAPWGKLLPELRDIIASGFIDAPVDSDDN